MTRERIPIRGEGELMEAFENGLFRTRMPNGYFVDAHLAKHMKNSGADLAPGDRVLVEFSAYQMTQAKILGRGEG